MVVEGSRPPDRLPCPSLPYSLPPAHPTDLLLGDLLRQLRDVELPVGQLDGLIIIERVLLHLSRLQHQQSSPQVAVRRLRHAARQHRRQLRTKSGREVTFEYTVWGDTSKRKVIKPNFTSNLIYFDVVKMSRT